MHFRFLTISWLFFLISNLSHSQENKRVIDEQATIFITKKACDCEDAIPLKLTKAAAFIYPNPPKGFGIQEIKSNGKIDPSFEQEHNSTWYLLAVQNTGELTFEITPIDSANDYDFLLYPYNDSNFCNDFINKKVVALRGNQSISTLWSTGKTGLSSKAATNFTGKKVGAMFSKSIKTKAGEKYMLVIDNATQNGKGYGMEFNCVTKITINGKITDELKQPIKTCITLLDRNNNEVVKVINSDDGSYKLTTEVNEEIDYSLLFYNDSCMPHPIGEEKNKNKRVSIKILSL